jgi:Tfp pilus assembly protein PilN
VRAVNLIPAEERRGSAGGGSSLPTFGVIGVLALLLVGVTAWVVLSNQISDRKAELAREQRQTGQTQAQAARLKPYTEFAQLEQKRVDTVRQLADSRFDWENTMHDLARVVTTNVWLTSFTGTVAPGVNIDSAGGGGGAGGTSNLRAALPNPAIELSGCATSQSEVARFLSRLRAMRGVTRVTLSDASKSDTPASGGAPTTGGSGSSSSDCRQGSAHFPLFNLIIFFKPLPGGSSTASGSPVATSATAKPAGSPPATGSSPAPSTPASTGGSK